MNWLILKPEQISSDGCVTLRGEQFFSLNEQVELVVGVSVAVGVFGQKLGRGVVKELGPDRVKLSLDLNLEPPGRTPISLIISVPRPQTVKKVLQLAASVGINAVHFIKSGNVIPSYLQSKSLFPENIEGEMWKALGQVGDTQIPKVSLWHDWKGLSDTLKRTADADGASPISLVADPRAETGILLEDTRVVSQEQEIFLAIGPESGWDDRDLSMLYALGFQALSLGERIHRVEIATALCLGKLQLIRGISLLRNMQP